MTEFDPPGIHTTTASNVSMSAKRVLLALVLCVSVSAAIALVANYQVVGAFEAFGITKRYGLPIIYLIFLLAIFLPSAKPAPRALMPVWWTSLLVILALSTLMAIIVPRQDIDLDDLAQGVALISGMLLLAWTGLLTPRWEESQQYGLIYLLGTSALVASVFNLSLGPFVTVPIPVAFGLIYAGIRLQRRRVLFLLMGVVSLTAIILSLRQEVAVSISVLTQIAACAVLLVAALLPIFMRRLFILSVVMLTVAGFVASPIPILMAGRLPAYIEDVTLLHRGYETIRVFELVDGNVLSLFLGLGPSATVDLTTSPDAETLAASGRVLSAVDDVHFLTSWVLMKLGLFGIGWLILVYRAIGKELLNLLSQPRPPVFESFLMMVVLAGAISGIPAATNFFANPLAALFLGMLITRRRVVQVLAFKEKSLPTLPEPGSADVEGRGG